MDLFTKINCYIDYRNSYSIKRALTTLGREFNLAVSRNNIEHARATIYTVKQIQDRLSLMYRESEDLSETMSYSQKFMSQQMRKFVAYLIQRMKTEFGVLDHEQEIEQIIGE